MIARVSPRRGVDLLLLPERVEAALWRAHTEERNAETRTRLFEHYRPFAARLANAQFARRRAGSSEREDIEQLAYDGLLQAIQRFDCRRNVPFEAYARIRINGHIANGLAQASEAAAQSRHRRRTERDRLKSLHPSSVVEPLAALSALSATIALGLMLDMDASAELEAIPDPAPSPYESLAWNELHTRIHQLVDNLPERESFVIRQHYRNGVSFQQIALLMGVTKGRVSQIHRSGLEKLRSLLAKLR
ncbi:MAG: sigma-70 family RNA polymerase sigma factor [Candidatus Andeanibacterium colombiense]|uniref:Sigma-70 family RNA polymerase sigma factor n=1 Tax=Candidatus Andeanibacterium colombiense TaxID=3121345 RepID=A0AAJ5X511_9SPHN|nr:MAG: sigma-70 family RNA polymerase sigma factor [Sphingomonadaceae bacterium]